MRWLLTNICRLLLSVALIFSGAVKIIDPRGTEYKITDYASAFGLSSWMVTYLPLVCAVLLGIIEFCLGIYLLFGIRRRLTARLVFLMFCIYMPLTLYLAITNAVSDCGCFGDAIVLTNWQTFFKNVILLLCCIVILTWTHLQTQFVSRRTRWLVLMYTWVYGLVLAIWCITTLPVMDFRPYHVGADLWEEMTWRDDGSIPPLADFQLFDETSGEDITDSILNAPGWKFLIVAPRLETADDGVMDRLAALTDYCREHNYMLICLTQSDTVEIECWRDMTGAEYNFCMGDETILKTIIRSNPGLLLLHGSTVAGKWAASQLPDEDELKEPVEKSGLVMDEATIGRHFLNLVLWFFIPLVICSIIDIKPIKNKKKMRKHIVAGNWKMNKNLQEGVALATELKGILAAEKPNCEVIIGTPFIHLATVSELLKDSVIAVSAENCADKEKGAYTGEVSAEMVKSTGAEYVILGHSERREYYHETPEILKEKVDLALANGLKVIFCIGESLAQREANEQETVCKAELAGSVFHLTAEQWKNITIAYEPIWAIGTGKTATADQAEEIHAYIRKCVAEVYGKEAADNTSILYGGSCKGSNAPELFAKADIDGGLIGGASLKAPDFKAIIDAWK